MEIAYVPGRTLYTVIHYGGQVWNKDTSLFENYNQANWTHYAVPMSEQTSSGYYSCAYPAGIVAGTLSTDVMYQQNGATPTLPALPGGDSYLSIGQTQGSNIQNINGISAPAVNLSLSAGVIVVGAAAAGTLSTTQMTTNLSNSHDSAYNGRIVIWTSGVLIGQASNITAYNHTNGLLTFTAVTNAPSAADTFVIV